MASSAKTLDPLLVSLKAVDPMRYPFYGDVELQPAGKIKDVLKNDTVVVAEDLLIRLRLNPGDSLKIGSRIFRIAAVVVNEPDRLSGNFAAGPRASSSHAMGSTPAASSLREVMPDRDISSKFPNRPTALYLRRCSCEAEGEAGEAAARIAGDRLSRDESCAHAGPRSRDQSALADELGGAGPWRCRGRDGDASSPGAETRHHRHHEVPWRGIGRDHSYLSDPDPAVGIAGRHSWRCGWWLCADGLSLLSGKVAWGADHGASAGSHHPDRPWCRHPRQRCCLPCLHCWIFAP